jgi:hypothetical protein
MWDVTRYCVVIFTDVLGQRVSPILKGQKSLEDGTDTLSRKFGKKKLPHGAAEHFRIAQITLRIVFLFRLSTASAQDVHRTDSKPKPLTEICSPLYLPSVPRQHEPVHTKIICSFLQRTDVTAVWLAKHTWRILHCQYRVRTYMDSYISTTNSYTRV